VLFLLLQGHWLLQQLTLLMIFQMLQRQRQQWPLQLLLC
jgi:hypothetical protein